MAKKTIIRHIQGNRLEIHVPLSERTVTSTDGNVDTHETAIEPSNVTVRLYKRGIARYDLTPTINGNMLVIVDNGTIQLGKYDIEIFGTVTVGNRPLRFKECNLLHVVDATDQGGEYDTDEYNVIAYYPFIQGREHAIVIDGDKVYMEIGGNFGADDDPTDNKATIFTGYGEGTISIEDNKVILDI